MDWKLKLNRWIKEFLLWGIAIFILSNIINYFRQPELTSTQLPNVTVQLIDGNSYSLQKGKPMIIHFWAIWCPTCQLEASNIENLSKYYDVLTIAVRSGNDKKLKSYLQKRKFSFRVLNDREGKWAQKFNVAAFPTTFIYDSHGVLHFTEVGYTTTAGLMARIGLLK